MKRLRFAFVVFVGERESQTEEVVEGSDLFIGEEAISHQLLD